MKRKLTWISVSTLLAICLAVLFFGVALAEPTVQPSISLFQQCANDDGDGFDGNPGDCNWINGALGTNNSTYAEHDATPQRIYFKNLVPGETYWVQLGWQTTKGGRHAYDYLIDYDHSENWVATAKLCVGAMDCTGLTPDTYLIPKDPLVIAWISSQPDGYFKMFNGDITAVSGVSMVTGDYTGDSTTALTLTFTANASDVLLTWGAHVAAEADWGVGNSCSNISGKPYHMQILACSPGMNGCGNQDNQLTVAFEPTAVKLASFSASSGGRNEIALAAAAFLVLLAGALLFRRAAGARAA
ncbi:MAG: hypothetical protein PHS96_06230 [Anaerolineales bacterium]|nr:hypothetical protein [Anaerolineales bacterium]